MTCINGLQWSVEKAYRCSPVQSCRKFSAVLGHMSANSSIFTRPGSHSCSTAVCQHIELCQYALAGEVRIVPTGSFLGSCQNVTQDSAPPGSKVPSFKMNFGQRSLAGWALPIGFSPIEMSKKT
jgi:hypothetical protein